MNEDLALVSGSFPVQSASNKACTQLNWCRIDLFRLTILKFFFLQKVANTLASSFANFTSGFANQLLSTLQGDQVGAGLPTRLAVRTTLAIRIGRHDRKIEKATDPTLTDPFVFGSDRGQDVFGSFSSGSFDD
jgi:hypothetical protein